MNSEDGPYRLEYPRWVDSVRSGYNMEWHRMWGGHDHSPGDKSIY